MGELLRRAHGELHSLDAASFERKAAAQHRLVATGEDLRVLKRAMQAFRSLQHVQILRLQDEADRHLLDYLHENDPPDGDDEPDDDDGGGGDPGGGGGRPPSPLELVDLRWTPACTRATQTIGLALVAARSPFSRFSGPMMSAQSALVLAATTTAAAPSSSAAPLASASPSASSLGAAPPRALPDAVPALAERLTCLELHLEDGSALQDRLLELSGLFRQVFQAARHMQAVHIGFPTHRPVRVPLERVFNGVRWAQLRALGVQSWRLGAAEIVALARRHAATLRGLRLRDVLLRDGSRWVDVLTTLRGEMERLEWVSLRRIDYSDHFDALWAGSMEVPDHPPGNGSDSDDEDDDGFHAHVDPPTDLPALNHHHHHPPDATDGAPPSVPSDDDDSDWDASSSAGLASNADTDHGPGANALPLSPDTPPSAVPPCTCASSSGGGGGAMADATDLGDDGRSVAYAQRKFWEKWVVGRCPEHSERRAPG